MEIGVADGDNARKMVTVTCQNAPVEEMEYYGFDTFGENDDDSQMKMVRQKLERTGCKFRLFKGDSVKTLPKVLRLLPKMDLIFIDGGHSYPTVKSDWENSKSLMSNKTAVFFHNYNFSGVKQVVDNIPREQYQIEIIDPPSDPPTAHVKKKT